MPSCVSTWNARSRAGRERIAALAEQHYARCAGTIAGDALRELAEEITKEDPDGT
jgi:hypothetical protein